MYKLIMKQSYIEFEFLFDDFTEGCQFMSQALDHSSTEITFTIYKIDTEEEATDEA